MVSPFYNGYTQSTAAPSMDSDKGAIMQWLLQNKRDAGGKTGLINQMLTSEGEYGPPMPTGHISTPEEIAQAQAFKQNNYPDAPPIIRSAQPMMIAPNRAASAPMRSQPQKPSGADMEVQSKSAIDNLMQQMAASRAGDAEDRKRQMWLNFFGRMASSTSSSLGGTIADASSTLAPTISQQMSDSRGSSRQAIEDQLKVEQWKEEQRLKERAVGADEMRARAFADKADRVPSGGGGGSISKQVQLQNMAIKLSKAADAEVDPERQQQYREQAAIYQQQAEIMRGGAAVQTSAAGSGADPLGLR